jgi:uncharacterized protein (DUF697 family)
MQRKTCSEKSREYVHWAAGGGAAWSAVPIPGMTTVGLIALESMLIYWVGKIYGEKLDKGDILMIAGGLELASLGIKIGVLELLNLVPVAGWLLKASVAAGVIEGIGALVIKHFEDKFPGRFYTVDPEVEGVMAKKNS